MDNRQTKSQKQRRPRLPQKTPLDALAAAEEVLDAVGEDLERRAAAARDIARAAGSMKAEGEKIVHGVRGILGALARMIPPRRAPPGE